MPRSSPFPVLDWGLATHTRLGKQTTLFSRLFCDDVFGQQLVVQTSYHMPRKPDGTQVLLSGLGAMNFGNDIGAGFSVTKMFPQQKPGMAPVPPQSRAGRGRDKGGEAGERRDRREEVIRAGDDGGEDDGGRGGEAWDSSAPAAAGKKPASFSFFATDTVEIRALCAKSGNHSLSLNANFGVVDNAA